MMDTLPAASDPLVDEILDVFAHEARIDRSLLRLDARADELGVTSLDLALALFEIEARFGVTLVDPPADRPPPTVGELVQQVLDARRKAMPSVAPNSTATPTSGAPAI